MISQKHCPFSRVPALTGCEHLALAAEGRDFVRRCVELCQGGRVGSHRVVRDPSPGGASERGVVTGARRLHLAGDGILRGVSEGADVVRGYGI